MKQILPIFVAASLLASPISAQDPVDPDTDQMSEGMNLLHQGTRLLLEGLMQELGPVLEDLEGQIEDLNAYHLPEVLPNGDIIIRRRVPLVPEHLDEDGEVDL